jgi:hypothetical protein
MYLHVQVYIYTYAYNELITECWIFIYIYCIHASIYVLRIYMQCVNYGMSGYKYKRTNVHVYVCIHV